MNNYKGSSSHSVNSIWLVLKNAHDMKYFLLFLHALVNLFNPFLQALLSGRYFFRGFSIVPLAPSTPGGKTVAELSWCCTAVSLPLPLPKCMQCSVFLRNCLVSAIFLDRLLMCSEASLLSSSSIELLWREIRKLVIFPSMQSGEQKIFSRVWYFPVGYCLSCLYHFPAVFEEPWSSDSPLGFFLDFLIQNFAWDQDLGLCFLHLSFIINTRATFFISFLNISLR